MSDINVKATAILECNGKQAEDQLKKLRQRAEDLRNAMAKAAASGNKADLSKFQRELDRTNRKIKACQTDAMNVADVMRKLDKATPKELNQALSKLRKELNNIERGSDAWNAQVARIKKVKAELDSVNQSLLKQEGFLSRMNTKINEWGMAIASGVAALTGLVMAGKQAVNIYAEIEQEMANVRKFTGMSAEEVEILNEEFKKLDTRTSREDLNKLAEEAGRLGKTSQADVLGFVKAADQINVALDDLGDGATLTLSKLTSIFGDEQKLGTERSLLAVGSVINELSQNCTASAPYLAEFSQRMAGVGAQAKMTVPQIMAFAAVLDANGQKVEASATALSQLTMKLFQDPAKIANAVGLDVQKMTETLKRSTNEGLILLLEKLKELGGIDVLAPIFKDMGTDGARASQVIAALAGNIEMVKWEQEEANKAFEEATSVTKEFEVQNNTVQAGLDKAKKGFTEMAASLGQKLLPVMRYAISGTSAMMRVISTIVSFIIKYKSVLLDLAIGIAAYTVAVNIATIKTQLLALAQATAKASTYAWMVAQQAANIATALLTGNISRLRQEIKVLSILMKTTPWGIAIAGITAIVVAITSLSNKVEELAVGQKSLNEIKDTAVKKMVEEKQKIDLLVRAAQNEKLSLDERHKAIDKLNKIIPGYNAQLDDTTGKYQANKKALDDYISSLAKKYEIEGAKDKLAEIGKKRVEGKIKVSQSKVSDTVAKSIEEDPSSADVPLYYLPTKWLASKLLPGFAKSSHDVDLYKEGSRLIKEANEEEAAITGVYGEDIARAVINEAGNTGQSSESDIITPSTSQGDNGEIDKFKSAKEWKEKELALNRIYYATGQKDYEEYIESQLIIENEFQKKKLQTEDLTSSEILSITAQSKEAEAKLQEFYDKSIIDNESSLYEERKANLKQLYIDGQISINTYNTKSEQIEMDHLRAMVGKTKEGTEERAKAEKEYRDKLFEDKKKKQQETEQAEKEHQKELARIKADAFGNTPSARKAKLDKEMGALQEVYDAEILAAGDNAVIKLEIEEAYQKAKLALAEKYGESQMNSMQRANEKFREWMDSDGGKAVIGAFDTVTSGMSAIFTQMSSLVQSELEIQTAAIEKRYEKEISLAEGNNYKVAKLEKQKEKEIAKAKNDANRKMFAMQVIQAVAQTAQNALSAYGSAAAIPVVGYILAPIAAAMAVAAGSLQIAAIKKQAQASQAQGYSQGGFTKKGRVDEPAGTVHAGEWVASQRLVNNSATRPIINALEYAQRTNTIGSITQDDVSRSVRTNVQSSEQQTNLLALMEVSSAIKSLNERLQDPFVTVNTVTGDKGTLKAQEDYDKLIKNKTPKSRR